MILIVSLDPSDKAMDICTSLRAYRSVMGADNSPIGNSNGVHDGYQFVILGSTLDRIIHKSAER